MVLVSLSVRWFLRTPLHDYRTPGPDRTGPDPGPAPQSGAA